VLSYRGEELSGKSGIYAFVNKLNGKQYIGSSKNLYERMLHHLSGVKSNLALQQAFNKYGKENFQFVIYAYAPNTLPHITDLETLFMSYFPFEQLYNFAPTALSMQGYKHTEDTTAKMTARLLKPEYQPMFRKTHLAEARKLISKSGQLNPMFGKTHTLNIKLLMSNRKGTAVSLYNKN